MTAFTPADLAASIQAEQDAPPATVTIAYASGKTYVYQVADETRADYLRKFLAHAGRISGDFTPLS